GGRERWPRRTGIDEQWREGRLEPSAHVANQPTAPQQGETKMSEFTVYGVPGSPFMRSVLVALEEKQAPYRIEALAPGAIKSPEYLRLHPFGRVPVIRHAGFELYETQAILRYIDAAFAGPALQPKTPDEIGRMNQVIGINDWYLFPRASRVIVFERI